MQPSRRQLLVTIGGCAAAGLAGCIADAVGDEDSNDADGEGSPGPRVDPPNGSTDEGASDSPNGSTGASSVPTEGPLEARLVGPDAEITVFERSDVEVGEVQAAGELYVVPVTVSETQGDAFLNAIQDLDLAENYQEYEIVVTVDGEEIRRSGITAGLAHEWDSGDWQRQFVIQSPTEAEAQRLRQALV